MAESDLQRCLNEVAELIRALPVDFGHCHDLAEYREVATQSLRQPALTFVQRWPIFLKLLAATSSEQVMDFLVELAIRSRCPMAYFSPDERYRLSQAGFSTREQLLLGRLRDRLDHHEMP